MFINVALTLNLCLVMVIYDMMRNSFVHLLTLNVTFENKYERVTYECKRVSQDQWYSYCLIFVFSWRIKKLITMFKIKHEVFFP